MLREDNDPFFWGKDPVLFHFITPANDEPLFSALTQRLVPHVSMHRARRYEYHNVAQVPDLLCQHLQWLLPPRVLLAWSPITNIGRIFRNISPDT